MVYTVIVNECSYELPKKTIAVMEKLDEALKADQTKGLTVKQKYEKLHSFVKDIVGYENAKEMFGSDNISEIDLSDLTLAVMKIHASYEKPISDYQEEERNRKLNSLPIEKISSISKAVQSVNTMKGVSK